MWTTSQRARKSECVCLSSVSQSISESTYLTARQAKEGDEFRHSRSCVPAKRRRRSRQQHCAPSGERLRPSNTAAEEPTDRNEVGRSRASEPPTADLRLRASAPSRLACVSRASSSHAAAACGSDVRKQLRVRMRRRPTRSHPCVAGVYVRKGQHPDLRLEITASTTRKRRKLLAERKSSHRHEARALWST